LTNLVTAKDVIGNSFIHHCFGEQVVYLILISRFKWVSMLMKYCTKFDCILCDTRELSSCEFMVLCSFLIVVSAVGFFLQIRVLNLTVQVE